MGIRPIKSIGWGITVQGIEVNEPVVDQIMNMEGLSYGGLFDYIDEHNLFAKHRRSSYFNKEKFSELDETAEIFNYIDVISKVYDSDEGTGEDTWTVLFTPTLLSFVV